MTAQAGSAAPSSFAPERAALRRQMRHARATLSESARAAAARKVAKLLYNHRLLRPGRRIGVYLALRSEVDLSQLIRQARDVGCRLFVPRLLNERTRRMQFVPLVSGAPLKPNRIGVAEPYKPQQPIPARQLDCVLVPLLAFDRSGRRLGMGAGFYDRHFRFLRQRNGWRRPRLYGVAFELQRTDTLPEEPWDVPLDGVVTEHRLYDFRRGRA